MANPITNHLLPDRRGHEDSGTGVIGDSIKDPARSLTRRRQQHTTTQFQLAKTDELGENRLVLHL